MNWQFSRQDLATAVITANGTPILYDPSPTGSTTDCPGEPGQMQYRLDVAAEFGGRTTKDLFVTVQPGAQAQPEPF